MKKLLLIAAIGIISGCSPQKELSVKSKEPVYREQLLKGQISHDDYLFLIAAEKESQETGKLYMKGLKKIQRMKGVKP